MRIDNGWMRAAQVGDRRTSMDTAPSCAAPTLRHRIAMPCQHILRAVGTPGAVCARRLGPRRRVRAKRDPRSCSTCPARSASLVIPSRMALADDWRGCAARSCRALGSVAAPDGFRSCTASSGAANRTRHRRSSLLSTLPSLLGTATRNVQAPCVGSRLPLSSTRSRRSSAGSALLSAMDPLLQQGGAFRAHFTAGRFAGARWTRTRAATAQALRTATSTSST